MGKGSCLCKAVEFQYGGDAMNKGGLPLAVCHCRDCQKITGSAFSVNVILPEAEFKVTKGTPKKYTSKADSGRSVTTVFCGDCGSPLWREGEMTDPMGAVIVRAGAMDGEGDGKKAMLDAEPKAEIYAASRTSWIKELEGKAQVPGMM